MSKTIRVNFQLPIPLFPLPEAILLPQSVTPLHIFEPRYRQMVETTLDRSGQIAMACFADETWRDAYDAAPPLRPVVCLGQIVQHERVSDGYNIVLHGVCRARIMSIVEASGSVLFRSAQLRPMLPPEHEDIDAEALREELESLLCQTDLRKMESVGLVRKCIENRDMDTSTVLEVIAAALVHDPDLRYQILAEASVTGRGHLVRDELCRLHELLLKAYRQHREDGDYRVTLN